jgi:hypothetical protein
MCERRVPPYDTKSPNPVAHRPQRFSGPGWRIGSTTFLKDFPSTVSFSSRVTLAPLTFMLELNPLRPPRNSSSRSSRFSLWMFAFEKLISYRAVRPEWREDKAHLG